MIHANAREFFLGSFVRCEYDVVVFNSSNLTMHGKCFVKSNIYLEEDVLVLIVRTRIPDV